MKVFFTFIGGVHSTPASRIRDMLAAHRFRETDAARRPSVTFVTDLRTPDVAELIRGMEGIIEESQWRSWSLLVTDRAVWNADGSEGISQLVLVEFWQTVWVDSEGLDRLKAIDPELVSHFHWDERFQLHVAQWPPDRPSERIASLDEHRLVDLEQFSNGPDAGALGTTIQAKGFKGALEIARRAYRDVRISEYRGLGGLNAVVLLSAERNGRSRNGEPQGEFVLYNLAALGLRYSSEPESLANLVGKESVKVIDIIAEPEDEGEA
jgi:hypothetical protein